MSDTSTSPKSSVMGFAALLNILGFTDDEFVSLGHEKPGGEFRAAVLTPADAVDAIARTSPRVNMYFGVSPVTGPPRRDAGRGKEADVTRLAALCCDLDVKPGGCRDLGVARAIIDELSSVLGTRPSAVVDSGHGLHPYWPIDDGHVTDVCAARALLRRWGRLVAAVAETYGAQTDSVFDLPRMLRAPGTCNNKINGQAVPVACHPDTGGPLTLAEVGERLDEHGIYEEDADRRDRAQVSDPAGWAFAATTCNYMSTFLDGLPGDGPKLGGGRHQWLLKQAVRLACGWRLGCITEADYRRAGKLLGQRLAELRAATGQQAGRFEVANAFQFGAETAAAKTEVEARAELGDHPHVGPATEFGGQGNVPEFTVTTLSNVAPERVKWLWPGRLPLGKLITLDGDPGKGKSTLALTFGAVVTTGGAWPDGPPCDYPGDVILLSAEDGLADTVRPRLDAAGGNPARVHAVQGVPLDGEGEALRMATLADIELLRRLVKRTHARLVIVDVLMAYLPTGTDSHRDQDVRQVLARMSALAESTGCAILLLRHLNKGKGDPLYRGGGSIGIVGASRVGLLAAPDPDDDDVRVLASVKNNLAPTPSSLTYRLVSDDRFDVARIEWIGVSEHDARALLSEHHDDSDGSVVTEARNWLEDYLSEQGRVRSRDAKNEGRKAGFSQASIDRAASKLRVISEAEGFPRITYWTLPLLFTPDSPRTQQSSQSPQPPGVGVTDVTGGASGAIRGFQPPVGPGRCLECGCHIEQQGHKPDCTANLTERTDP